MISVKDGCASSVIPVSSSLPSSRFSSGSNHDHDRIFVCGTGVMVPPVVVVSFALDGVLTESAAPFWVGTSFKFLFSSALPEESFRSAAFSPACSFLESSLPVLEATASNVSAFSLFSFSVSHIQPLSTLQMWVHSVGSFPIWDGVAVSSASL